MFEDNPLEPSPFVLDPNDFSTFLDFDINSSSSSRHPSPTVPTIVEPQSDLASLWFNFSNVNDDLLNVKPTIPESISGSPWDFLTFSNASPDSGTPSTSSGLSPPFAIDPQLMATPATSKASSDFGDDDAMKDENLHEEEDDEDDEGPVTPPPVRPPNKGKDRKSVVHSGGIQKKVLVSSVVKTDPLDHALDDWRPTPEEYQKMSSREKRQLRNKISARNFRNRRKGEHFPSFYCSFVGIQPFYVFDANRIHQHPRERCC
jgi:bZIP-type transcription factor MBZ1